LKKKAPNITCNKGTIIKSPKNAVIKMIIDQEIGSSLISRRMEINFSLKLDDFVSNKSGELLSILITSYLIFIIVY